MAYRGHRRRGGLSPYRRYGALNQFVGGFGEGYDAMSKWVSEHREEEDKQRQRKTRDLIAQMSAQGPQTTTQAIPATTVQAAGTDHPGRMTPQQTQPREITTRDWASMREQGMRAYLQSGDVAGATAWDDYVNRLQHRGAMQYGGQALALLQQGNTEGAAQALNQANQYFPNGSRSVYEVINGQLVMMGLDEETGEPRGKPVMVTPDYITNVLANMQDPKNFLAWTKDRQAMQLKKEELAAMKKWREDQTATSQERNKIMREEIAARIQIAASKSGLAEKKGAREAGDRAANYALKAFDKLSEQDIQALADADISASDVATEAALIGMTDPNATAAEAWNAALQRIRTRLTAQAQQGSTTAAPTQVGGVPIPPTREPTVTQFVGDPEQGLTAPLAPIGRHLAEQYTQMGGGRPPTAIPPLMMAQ